MSLFLKQSTASQEILLGPFLDDDDGVTQKTGLTIANTDIQLFKSGATAFANKNSGGATELANGFYYAVLDDTDTNTVGLLVIKSQVTDCLCVRHEFMVLPANVYDSFMGTDKLQVHADEITAGLITAASIADAAIDFATFAADCKTGAGLKANVESISAGAITATAIATDAIDNDAIAASAVTEIQSGLALDATVAKEATLSTVAGYLDTEVAAILAAVDTEVAAIKAKTDNLPASPAATSDIPTAAVVADAVWDEAATGHTDAGKAGAQLWTDIDAILEDTGTTLDGKIDAIDNYVDTEIAAILEAVDTEVAAIKAKTDQLTFTVPNSVDATATATVDTSAIADAVWDETVADHTIVGSTGAAIAAAGGSGDPWATALPGSYGAGTAGNIIGNLLKKIIGIFVGLK